MGKSFQRFCKYVAGLFLWLSLIYLCGIGFDAFMTDIDVSPPLELLLTVVWAMYIAFASYLYTIALFDWTDGRRR
jgi:hypothetical protein